MALSHMRVKETMEASTEGGDSSAPSMSWCWWLPTSCMRAARVTARGF